MSPQNLLALDFDGVICDSRLESFVVSLKTYTCLHPGASLAGHPVLIATDGETGPPDLHSDAVYGQFLRLAPWGNRAEDFGVALHAIEKQVPVASQIEYDLFYETCDQTWRNRFHGELYRQRDALRMENPAQWAAWHGLFHPLIDALRTNQKNWHYGLATAKDRRSVDFLLNHWGIADLFPAELIADKETGVQKTAHLTHLQKISGIPFAAITFIDDKVNHLIKVAPLGVHCVLAAWGTEAPEEAASARGYGFTVAHLSDIEKRIFSIP